MNPPSPTALALKQQAAAVASLDYAFGRLWPLIEVDPATPTARALEAALLAPARSMLERGGKRFRGTLVDLAWRLAGGGSRCPMVLPALIEVIHAGSLIIDDIEDDSAERRGAPTVHRLYGLPLALNAGNWLYFWALELLEELDLPAGDATDLRRRVARMLVRGHAGQALDIDTDVCEVSRHSIGDHVRTMCRLKTGSFMALAAALGGRAASGDDGLVDALETFGLRLGCALQMLDDLGNLVSDRDRGKRYEDLLHGRANWPWAWLAETCGALEWHALRARLREVREGRADVAGLAAELSARVTRHGRQQVRAHLARAFEDLQAAVGDVPLLSAFRDEITRLETSYV